MSKRFLLTLPALAVLLAPALVRGSDIVFSGGGTLAQIVDGGGTSTIITIVNLDPIAAPYQLSFFSDNGNPLTLSTTAGTGPVLTGNLSAGGSVIIQTNGGGSAVLQGYAVLATGPLRITSTGLVTSVGNQLAGSAVFSIPLSSGTVAQASCPLDTGADYLIELPFDETGDATSAQTGVAIANSFGDAQYQTNGIGQTAFVNVSFFDQNGVELPVPTGQVPTVILQFGAHTSFLLDQQFPQIMGMKGKVRFTGANANGGSYAIKVLGLRATPTTFTSITPLIPCNPLILSNGTYAGCNN